MMNLGELIQRCRQNFGVEPRTLPRSDRRAFALKVPLLMQILFLLTGDKLRRVVRDQDIVRDHGRVVWGVLVQANQKLFSPENRLTLPAVVIYSSDLFFDDRIDVLANVAEQIYELKDSPSDDELESFGAAVRDELSRPMQVPIPRSLCQGRETYFTTCLIQPSHLPGGAIGERFFPLVVCPEKTELTMVLPARYWPEELRKSWETPT